MSEIEVPDGLGAAGVELWREVIADVDEEMEFDVLERRRLAGACRLADDLAEIRADIVREGMWIETRKGRAPNPMMIRREAAERALNHVLSTLSVQAPAPKTGHLSRAQRNRLRDMNRAGYG